VNSHGQEPLETVPDDEASEASDGCGRSATRGLFQGVILEMENGDREGIFYGAILGRVRFHPSVGISFIFEHGEGMWKVTISGRAYALNLREFLARSSTGVGHPIRPSIASS
jgi:hypothetical protein